MVHRSPIQVHLKFSGEDTTMICPGLGWNKDKRRNDKVQRQQRAEDEEFQHQCPCAAAAWPKDEGGVCRILMLRRRHRHLHLLYPPWTVPHRQISQTGTFLSSTYIWSASWTLPSQYWRVSVGTKMKQYKSKIKSMPMALENSREGVFAMKDNRPHQNTRMLRSEHISFLAYLVVLQQCDDTFQNKCKHVIFILYSTVMHY